MSDFSASGPQQVPACAASEDCLESNAKCLDPEWGYVRFGQLAEVGQR
jgi:hypothetical protein